MQSNSPRTETQGQQGEEGAESEETDHGENRQPSRGDPKCGEPTRGGWGLGTFRKKAGGGVTGNWVVAGGQQGGRGQS